jgi:hypothetical protein
MLYFHYILVLEVTGGVDLDLSHLYHGLFMFLGLIVDIYARVALYKEASASFVQIITHHL